MELNSFIKSNHKSPYDRFSTDSPLANHNSNNFPIFYQKPYKTQEAYTSKTEHEDDYNEKMNTLKHFYQLRLRGFEESITKLYHRIFDDELMKTLKKDSISADFIHERVKEIFQEILSNDKEILLTNITSQYAMLKGEFRRVETEKNELAFEYNKELSNFTNRLEDLSQELTNEKKMKESLIEENCEMKQRLDDYSGKLKYEIIAKEEEKIKILDSKKHEIQEISKDKLKKEEEFQRLSQINIEMRKGLQALKQEKEDLIRKNKEFDMKTKTAIEDSSKYKRKVEEFEIKLTELKDKLTLKTNEINMLRFEQKNSLDNSFRTDKENIIKIEEYHLMFNAFEEKIESQKKQYQEKKAKIKQKALNYKKKLQTAEKKLSDTIPTLETDIKRVESERNILNQKNKDLEVSLEEMKKKHMISLSEISSKYEEDLEQNEKKFERYFEMTTEKLRFEHNQDSSLLKSEIEKLTKLLEDFSDEQSMNYIRRTDHFSLINELESLIEELKRENENKDLQYHTDILQKQNFFEEKFQKDLELLQNGSNQKSEFFEEKYIEETEKLKELEEDYKTLDGNYKKLAKEKAFQEQEIANLKSQISTISRENSPESILLPYQALRASTSAKKLQISNEDLRSQLTSAEEKSTRYSKEIYSLKKKIDEQDSELHRLNDTIQIRSRKIESMQEEYESLKNKGALEEKTSRGLLNSMRDELENSKRENNSLKHKIGEITRENSEFYQTNTANIKGSKDKFELEEKLRDKSDELNNKEIKISRLEKNIKLLEGELERKNEENQSFLKDKKDLIQKMNIIKHKFKEMKLKIQKTIQRKLQALQKENIELKAFVKKSQKTALNDITLQINFSLNNLKTSLKKKDMIYEEEISKLRDKPSYDINLDSISLRKEINDLQTNRKQLEMEMQSLLKDNSRLKQELQASKPLKNEEGFLIDFLKEENQKLISEAKSMQEKIALSSTRSDKNEENKRLFNELMQLRAAIDTLYTKHKQILEEVTLDIERLKEKQTEEISHINQNYTEMINVMTEKLDYFKRDDNNKSTNIVKMSQRIEHLEKVNKQLEIKLNYSAELPIIENPIKSYESPSLKSNRVDNSHVLNNKSIGDIEKIYENFDGKDKSDIMDPHTLNYYGQMNSTQSNNKNMLYSSISRDNEPNNLSYLIMNDEKKIKQFSYEPNNPNKPQQLTQKEVDDLKNLLAYTYKNVADNKESTKKFMEEADNLTDKVKELQKMHEFIGNSSFIKKYQSMSGIHRSTKSHDSPEFPNYAEKLAQLYSPISVKPSMDRDDQINLK